MRFLLPIVLVVALAPPPALAEHCRTWSVSSPEMTYDLSAVGGPPIYQDNDFDPYHTPSIWIYQESNGLAGLQRGDEVVDDTCHGMVDADTVIF